MISQSAFLSKLDITTYSTKSKTQFCYTKNLLCFLENVLSSRVATSRSYILTFYGLLGLFAPPDSRRGKGQLAMNFLELQESTLRSSFVVFAF